MAIKMEQSRCCEEVYDVTLSVVIQLFITYVYDWLFFFFLEIPFRSCKEYYTPRRFVRWSSGKIFLRVSFLRVFSTTSALAVSITSRECEIGNQSSRGRKMREMKNRSILIIVLKGVKTEYC